MKVEKTPEDVQEILKVVPQKDVDTESETPDSPSEEADGKVG